MDQHFGWILDITLKKNLETFLKPPKKQKLDGQHFFGVHWESNEFQKRKACRKIKYRSK